MARARGRRIIRRARRMHDETHEQEQEEGGYSRLGTAIFYLLMAFPFVAVGYKLFIESFGAFAIYAFGVVALWVTCFLFYRFAPAVVREPDPPASSDLNSFDSERQGVPW